MGACVPVRLGLRISTGALNPILTLSSLVPAVMLPGSGEAGTVVGLVLNAGLVAPIYVATADGIESNLQVNPQACLRLGLSTAVVLNSGSSTAGIMW